MNADQLGFTLVLVAALMGLAVYFGRQQVRTLRSVAVPDGLDPEDRRYLRAQAYRRMVCSVLMVILAGLLFGSLFLDAHHLQLQTEAEQKEFLHQFWLYLSIGLFVLLLLLVLATMDFWATARFGLSQHRKILADRRQLLQEQMARKRQERNGQHLN